MYKQKVLLIRNFKFQFYTTSLTRGILLTCGDFVFPTQHLYIANVLRMHPLSSAGNIFYWSAVYGTQHTTVDILIFRPTKCVCSGNRLDIMCVWWKQCSPSLLQEAGGFLGEKCSLSKLWTESRFQEFLLPNPPSW
jgi:hypothetical protein